MTDPALALLADRLDPPVSPYLAAPVRWADERLGEFLWSKQCEIVESVRDNRRTAVHSCHGPGKSFMGSRVASWWIDTHPLGDAFVVSTAPTFRQVRNILWREINRAHAKAKRRFDTGVINSPLPGYVNQTEWWIDKEIVAFGAKPKEEADEDENSTSDAFQGIHEAFVLVVIDEACGVPESLWNAADSLITNESARILAIGNPDDPSGHFARVCEADSNWNVIHIDAYDTPAFTGEPVPAELLRKLTSQVYVDEMREEHGEDSPIFEAKVRGRFPRIVKNGVVPFHWVERCRVGRDYHNKDMETRGQGVDFGVDVGAGGDESVIAAKLGPLARIIKRDRNPDTMKTTGLIIEQIREWRPRRVNIDSIGIGKGLVDRLMELKRDGHVDLASVEIIGINVGERSTDPEHFQRLRDQLWWEIGRKLSEHGGWDLSEIDEKTVGDLCAPRFTYDSAGRVCVEPKKDTKARLRRSPDSADALLLAFFAPGGRGGSINTAGFGPEPVRRVGDLTLRGKKYIDKDPGR